MDRIGDFLYTDIVSSQATNPKAISPDGAALGCSHQPTKPTVGPGLSNGEIMTSKTAVKKRVPNFKELEYLLLVARNTDSIHRNRKAQDCGTCVLNAGIVVLDSKGNGLLLVHAPFQGNVGSYEALKPVLKALQGEFPDFDIRWNDGVMD